MTSVTLALANQLAASQQPRIRDSLPVYQQSILPSEYDPHLLQQFPDGTGSRSQVLHLFIQRHPNPSSLSHGNGLAPAYLCGERRIHPVLSLHHQTNFGQDAAYSGLPSVNLVSRAIHHESYLTC